ncbi:PucR family transcriptional regulator [Pinirhizobacter soli]|uniref:PucR family transcriptional regulator n=1 Tax=Pinirhizobacter soli TaxID=2786953 RepID=UPI002029B744|nr:helix-turn-helix domain-containing protein [Pinirhizobacter soli]
MDLEANLDMKIPRVTGKLREMTAAYQRDPTVIVERTYRAISQSDAAYAKLPLGTKSDFMVSIRFSAVLWCNTILTGEYPSDEDMEPFRKVGRRRVHQGVPLASLLRAYRLGSKELWTIYLEFGAEHPDVQNELLFELSPYLLDHFDEMARAIAVAYMEEQYEQSRWKEALRYELCNLVFDASSDVSEFNRVSETIGIDPTIGRVALAFNSNVLDTFPSRIEKELDRMLVVVARTAKVNAADLVRVMYRGRLIVWIPCIRGDSILASDRRMGELATQVIANVAEFKQVGVGMMGQGPSGWSCSVDEAIKAMDVGERMGAGDNVYRYSDIALNEGARRSDNVLRYLESLIERLSHEPDLLRTLECYLEQFQKRKQTAQVLGIHPNTLNYRLERIEEIAGGNLGDPAWLAKLYVAIGLRKGSL